MKAKTTTIRKEVLGHQAPERASDSQYYDQKCPFTGGLSVKKELLQGKVIKRDVGNSATIEWSRPYFVRKYERYEMRRSRLRVHNPPVIDAQVGQTVLVAKTRPLSKTKNHVILKILDGDTTQIVAEDPTLNQKKINKNVKEKVEEPEVVTESTEEENESTEE
jgi:small subunit ribosomal protein S17